jgi:hypothetical protein
MGLTRGFSVVREIRYEQSLCVDYNNGVRRNEMDSAESVDLLGPGVVEILRNLNISEIDLQKEV